jgi:hypothetical protein
VDHFKDFEGLDVFSGLLCYDIKQYVDIQEKIESLTKEVSIFGFILFYFSMF